MLLLLLLLSPFNDEVIITLQDGKIIIGILQGYKDGKYLVLEGSNLRTIDESNILDIKITKEDPSSKKDEIKQQVEKLLFDKKDYPKAIEVLQEAKKTKKIFEDIYSYFKIAYFEYLNIIIKSESLQLLSNHMEFIKHELPERDASELFLYCYGYFREESGRFKSSKFLLEFARVLSSAAIDEGILKEKKQELEAKLLDLSEIKTHQNEYTLLREFHEILHKLNPDKYQKKLLAIYSLEGGKLILDKKYSTAVETLSKALLLDPKNEKITELFEKARFEDVKQKISFLPRSERIKTLGDYKKSMPKKEYIKWADEEIERIKKMTSDDSIILKDIVYYYPIEPKRWYKYRYTEGEITEKITIDSVEKIEGGLKVFLSQERTFKSYKYTPEFSIREINTDGIFNISDKEKQPLVKMPIRAGTTWSIEKGDQKITRSIISLSSNVQTPAGKFEDCLQVEVKTIVNIRGSKITVTANEYFAPNIGIVKIQVVEKEFQKYSLELVDYGKD